MLLKRRMRYIFLWFGGSDFVELFQLFHVPYQLSTLTGAPIYNVHTAIMYGFYLQA